MTRRRDIGEFKLRNFVISTIAFLLFGGFLYSKFDFYGAQKNSDETSEQNKVITNLKERISNLEKVNTDLGSEIKKLENQARDCPKSHGSKKKSSGCPKP